MPIDRSKMRVGAEAIDAANEAVNSGGGTFKPFLSSIYWGKDQDYRYVLILNPIEEIPQVDFHPFVDIGDGKPHQVIARTDPLLGEAVDPIQKTWLYKPRLTNLAIAVELEPVTERDEKGREKPVGFEVATRTFDRTILDDEGKPTDEKEEVTVPEVGLIAQSPINFFNQLRAYDASEASIHSTPLKITRLGKKDVTYTVVGYDTIPVDLTNLFEYIGDLSYLGEQADALLERIAGMDDDTEASAEIGRTLLDIKIDELADDEGYEELFQQITEPSRFPDKPKEKSKATKKERPTRTQRRATVQSGVDNADEVEVTDTPEEKPVARRRSAEESASKGSARQERLSRLRSRQEAAAPASE